MTARPGSLERVFFDLSSRVKLRVVGADRLRFLNGQLTNDVRKATKTIALEACVLNAKGKMEAHLFAHANGDSFILDADPALRSTLQAGVLLRQARSGADVRALLRQLQIEALA